MTLKLERPLAVIDIETTSVDVATARVVQIGIFILGDTGRGQVIERLVNPGVPISPEAIAVHGITDEMVKDSPRFDAQASDLLDCIGDCDLAGFNIEKFDLPILAREFEQCEIDFPGPARRIVDAMTIFHRNEKRDLSAAVRFYCGKEHEGAHGALADAAATAAVLQAQVMCYGLPSDTAGLEAYCHEKPDDYVDRDGKLRWKNGEAVFSFGKVSGKTLKWVAANDAGFLGWMLTKDFSDELKEIVRAALAGSYPTREVAP